MKTLQRTFLNNFATKNKTRCEHCNEILEPKRIKWLELSITDGNYYTSESFPKNHESQGLFSFGTACATIVINETINNFKTTYNETILQTRRNCAS